MLLGVAGAESAGREDLAHRGKIALGEDNIGRTGVLLHSDGAAGARDRDDLVSLREQSGQGELGDGDSLAVASRSSRAKASTFFSKVPGCRRGSVLRMSVASY
jgi:hypothetical protein